MFNLMFGRNTSLSIEVTTQNQPPEKILQKAHSLESKEGFLAKLIENRSNALNANISAVQEK